MSLRKKLLAFSALLVIVPGIVLAVLAERSGRASLERVIGRELARESQLLSDQISTLIRIESETVARFARQDIMREIQVGDLDKRISQALMTLQSDAPARIAYAVVNSEEQVIAASSAIYLRDSPAWANLDGHTTNAPRFASLPGDRQGLILSAPIPDPDNPNESLGTLVALLDWERVSHSIESVRRELATHGVSAQILIFDRTGVIRRRSTAEGIRPVLATLARSVEFAERKSSGLTFDDSGEWIVGRSDLSTPLNGWSLYILEPAEHAFAPAIRLRDRLVLTTSIALAAALVLAAFGAGRVVQPLSDLNQAIRGMARGERLEGPLRVRSDDEVGQVARAFNTMTRELDAVQNHLVEAEKFAFVGELAAGVAHQVRTSLGVLRNSAQILGRSLPDDTDRGAVEMIEMITAEVGRLGGIVDDLLTLDGRRAFDMRPIELERPVMAAVEFVLPQAQQEGIQIDVFPSERDLIVRCDRDAIEQVCLNLLTNAISSLEPGGRIEVRLDQDATGSPFFSVCDDGAGVAEELRERIFEPFVTGRAAGVGLGLTFVKKTVHAHNGTVRLERSPAGGACFVVRLKSAEEKT